MNELKALIFSLKASELDEFCKLAERFADEKHEEIICQGELHLSLLSIPGYHLETFGIHTVNLCRNDEILATFHRFSPRVELIGKFDLDHRVVRAFGEICQDYFENKEYPWNQ